MALSCSITPKPSLRHQFAIDLNLIKVEEVLFPQPYPNVTGLLARAPDDERPSVNSPEYRSVVLIKQSPHLQIVGRNNLQCP
jgi:hypothetical protein